MKTRTMTAIAAVCAALAVFAGCGGNNTASTTTTAASATTTTAAETTSGASGSESEDGDITQNLFSKGVWLAYKDGEPNRYFIFESDTKGRIEFVNGMGGTPFTCEQHGTEIIFHIGGADAAGTETRATFDLGETTGTFDYGDGNVVTYTFQYMPDLDPDTFDVVSENQGEVANTAVLFTKGVWLAHRNSFDGEPVQYFVFNDETSGHTDRADGTGGLSFSCEQNGTEIMFHFGSADDNTPAVFDLGEITGTFDYGDGNTVTYYFEHTEYDADTFDASTLG